MPLPVGNLKQTSFKTSTPVSWKVPLPHQRQQFTHKPSFLPTHVTSRHHFTKLFPRFCCWALIWLSYHWAWLRRGYWRYRSLIDWLIGWSLRKFRYLYMWAEFSSRQWELSASCDLHVQPPCNLLHEVRNVLLCYSSWHQCGSMILAPTWIYRLCQTTLPELTQCKCRPYAMHPGMSRHVLAFSQH